MPVSMSLAVLSVGRRSALVGAALVLACCAVVAQPAEAGPTETVSGRIAHWLPNPNGDVDGLLLDNDAQVSFSPASFAGLRTLVRLGDEVQVSGRRGAALGTLRALEIRDARSGRSIVDATHSAPTSPPAAREPAALGAMSASGRIAALLRSDRGDLDGVMLEDGVVVRFPPHAVASLAPALKRGAGFYARGYGMRGSVGSAFEATRLGASEDSAQDIFAPPGRSLPRARQAPPPPP